MTPEEKKAFEKEERRKKMALKHKKMVAEEKESQIKYNQELGELMATLLDIQEIKEKIFYINMETNPAEIQKLYKAELEKNQEICSKLKSHVASFPESAINERRATLIGVRTVALNKGLTIDTIERFNNDLEEKECFEVFFYCCLFWKNLIYCKKTDEEGVPIEDTFTNQSNEYKKKIFYEFKKNFFYDTIPYLGSLEYEMDGIATEVVRREPKKETKKLVFLDEETIKFKPIVFSPEEVIDLKELKASVNTNKVRVFDDTKEPLVMIFIGHVDHGKSTLCGSILRLFGTVSDMEFSKIKEEAKSMGMESWDISQITDVIEEEKEMGKTLETARAYFETKLKRFTILDCPGHNKLVQAMIDGASQADVASLIVSAKGGEFESGFLKGGQTREHAMLARVLGANHLVVVVNKMDTVDWSKERFEYIKRELEPFLVANCGFFPSNIRWVVISGYHQLNVHQRVDPALAPWYDGKCLFEVYDDIPSVNRCQANILRIPLLDKIKDMGIILAPCKINCGIVKPNMNCVLMPSQKPITITKVCDTADVELGYACSGDSVTLHLKGVDEDEIRRGFVICGQQFWITPALAIRSRNADFRVVLQSNIRTGVHLSHAHSHCSRRSDCYGHN
jgi:translation elongation factor EF-1alpha